MTPPFFRPAVRKRRRRVARWTVNVEAIERARIPQGWTLVDLSRAARVDRGTLSDLINETRQPTLGTVQAIAATLGLTMADVVLFASESHVQ